MQRAPHARSGLSYETGMARTRAEWGVSTPERAPAASHENELGAGGRRLFAKFAPLEIQFEWSSPCEKPFERESSNPVNRRAALGLVGRSWALVFLWGGLGFHWDWNLEISAALSDFTP